MVGRFPIEDVTPAVSCGRCPAKAVVGEVVPVSAVSYREGHSALGVNVVWQGPDGVTRPFTRMSAGAPGTDRWHGTIQPDATGRWVYAVEAWGDPYLTWWNAVTKKIEAGQGLEDLANDIAEGVEILTLARAGVPAGYRPEVETAITALADKGRPLFERVSPGLALRPLLWEYPVRELVTRSAQFHLWVDRKRALFSAWYEFFPRSEGAVVAPDGSPVQHGTFATATERLPGVAAMGFDILYLPPIHPIGRVNRKGRNNTLVAEPTDVGSPWAIGADEGGHDTIHPELGTLEDFQRFVKAAGEVGLEIAMDLALQCAPDHPWVKAHPEWFTVRPDGQIAYAENPPKKYQDIYPVNFDNDPEGIYAEVLRIVHKWMSFGVRIFRVDNPHTKPVEFWEWLLGEVRRTDPDVLFLSEAFTKPAMMRALGTVGFHQSYCYFTWRNAKWEIEEYFQEVAHETSHVLRPSFWVNTPDILPFFLQYGGPNAFKIRAVLAATGSPSWGVYAGFELYEHVALQPGKEEYLDSEKFQIRIRDWDAAEREGRTLAPYLTRLNEIRRRHPALQRLRNLTVHSSEDDSVMVFSKQEGEDTVIVVVNVDPHGTRETMVHLNMPALGLDWHDQVAVHDEITDETWTWGERNYIRLDPYVEPAHVLTVRRPHQ